MQMRRVGSQNRHMSPSRERKCPRRDERMYLPYHDERMVCPRRDDRPQFRERKRPRRDDRFHPRNDRFRPRDDRYRRDERPHMRERSRSRSRSRGREREPLNRGKGRWDRCSSPRRGNGSLGQGHARQLSQPRTHQRPRLGTCAIGRRLHNHHHCLRSLAAEILTPRQ